jgi:hypothetical protein
LDRTVWGGKFEAIVESEKYKTLAMNELFSKLKLVEVDRGMTAKIEGPIDSHSLALIGGSKGKTNANPSTRMFSLSSLMSMLDQEFGVLGEDELALLTRRLERLHENQVNMRRNMRTCFQCGKPGHFVADFPEKDENKDIYKHKSKTDGKYRSRRDHKSKHNNKHKDERRSRKKESRRDELPFLRQENERLGLLLDNRDDMLREAKKMKKELRVSLEDARIRVAELETQNLDAKLEIDSLKASPVVSDEVECADCPIFLADLAMFKEKHASKCEELHLLRVEVAELKSRPALLGASTSCPVLHGKIDEMHAYTVSLEAKLK